jgi:hypothetical protein
MYKEMLRSSLNVSKDTIALFFCYQPSIGTISTKKKWNKTSVKKYKVIQLARLKKKHICVYENINFLGKK